MSTEELAETSPADAMLQAAQTRNPLKKLYFWTLHWAATPYALPALILLSFTSASFFPISPDVLLMALCFSRPKKWLSLAAWCTLASVLGGILGYYIGWGLWDAVGEPIVQAYQGEEVLEEVKGWYDEFGFLGILMAAITPVPYKVFTIASGLMHFDLIQFTVASTIGRGVRFFAVAGLIGLFGSQVKPFLEKNFELTATIMVILGILGILALKFL